MAALLAHVVPERSLRAADAAGACSPRSTSSIAYVDAHGQELDRMAYVPDANLNIVSESRSRGRLLPTTKEHSFDAFDRLRSTSLIVLGEMLDENNAYSPGGNLLSAAGLRYRYDGTSTQAVTTLEGAHRVRSLQYDTDGQLIADHDEDGTASVHRTLTADASGCLRTVVETRDGPDGHHSSTTTHVCGASGRRVLRQTRDDVTGAVTRVIDVAGIAELRPDEGIVLLRIPVAGTTTLEEARLLVDGSRVEEKSGYLHLDVRGSVVARTSLHAPATVDVEEAEYDAWGNTLALGALPTHRFVGHEPDPGSGTYHFGRRVYDPTLRRWLSPDPWLWGLPDVDVNDAVQLNLYAYGANNPVKFTDASGMAIETGWDIFNVTLDAASLGANIATGNWSGAAVDGVALLLDVAATTVPGVPGGAGAALKVAREADQIIDVAKAGEKAAEIARRTEKAFDAAHLAKKGAEVAEGHERNLHDLAVAARDDLAAELATQRHRPATVVGAYSPSSGRVTAGASRGGGLGCAEGVCSEALHHPPDIQFTPAVRPRTGQLIDVCLKCENTYGRKAFLDPATRFQSDQEGR